MAKTQELQKSDGKMVSVYDYDDAEGGLEDLNINEQLTPFLRMLQGLSPQLNSGKPEYVPGSALGQIINTATEELYSGKDGLDIIVCARHYHYGMWSPRDLGGGFRGMLAPEHQLVVDTLARMDERYGPRGGRFHMPRYRDRQWTDVPPRHPESGEDVELVETGQLYVLFGPPGDLNVQTASRAIVVFTSTAFPVYQGYLERHRRWLWPTSDGTRKAASLWSYKWRLTTKADSNKKGDFFNWRLSLAPPAVTYKDAVYRESEPELFSMAAAFNRSFRHGEVKVDHDAARGDAEDIPL